MAGIRTVSTRKGTLQREPITEFISSYFWSSISSTPRLRFLPSSPVPRSARGGCVAGLHLLTRKGTLKQEPVMAYISSYFLSSVERFSLDCRKTKTKVNTLASQRA